MSDSRDPRVEPVPGDVFRKPPFLARVTMVGRSVHYELRREGATGIDALPMACRLSKKQFREWAKDSEVIAKGDANA